MPLGFGPISSTPISALLVSSGNNTTALTGVAASGALGTLTIHADLKPVGIQTLDLTNSYATSMTDFLLFYEGSGVPNNLAALSTATTLTGSPTWEKINNVYAGYTTGNNTFNVPDHGTIVGADFSVRLIFRLKSYVSFQTLFSKATGSTPGRELALFLDTSGNPNYMDVGGVFIDPSSIPAAFQLNNIYDLVITRSSTTLKFYINGVQSGGSLTSSGTTGISAPLRLSADAFGGANGDADIFLWQTWTGRALSSGEVLTLVSTPYAGAIDALRAVAATSAVGTFVINNQKALTGVAATGALGTLVVHADNTTVLTGVQSTSAVGSFTVHADNVRAITGVAATSAVGTFVINNQKALTGVAATGALGTLVVHADNAQTLTGVSSTSALGTLVVHADNIRAITGVAATSAVGTFAINNQKALTGVAATGANGTFIANETPVTLNPSDKNASITLTNGNLTATDTSGTSADAGVRATLGRRTGKYAFQFTIVTQGGNGSCGAGLANSSTSLSTWLGSDSTSVGMFTWPGTCAIWNGSFRQGDVGTTSSVASTFTMLVDLDNKRLFVQQLSRGYVKDGVFTDPTLATPAGWFDISSLGTELLYPALNGEHVDSITMNFGATPFDPPLPAGWTSWDGSQTSILQGVAAQGRAALNATLFLSHFDGPNAGTIPNADTGQALTFSTGAGTANLDTSSKQFGSASLAPQSAGIQVANTSWELGAVSSDPFTIELWFNQTSTTGGFQVLASACPNFAPPQLDDWSLGLDSSTPVFQFNTGTSDRINFFFSSSVSTGVWHHIAVVRDADGYRGYVDGVQQLIYPVPLNINSTDYPLSIGFQYGDNQTFIGNIDEVRISSVARYTGSSFTVPIAPFVVDTFLTINPTLTGVAATGAVGTLTIPSDITVALTGVSATGAVGTLTIHADNTQTLAGVAATGAVGTFAVAIADLLASVFATTAVGTFISLVTTTLSGVTATGAAGTLAIAEAYLLTGVSATGAVGSLVVHADNTTALTGVQSTSAVGSFTVHADNTTVLTGVQSTGAVGTLVVHADNTTALTGVQSTSAVGTLVVHADNTTALTGVASTSAVGSLVVHADNTTVLTGVQSTSAVGSFTVHADNVRSLSGIAATGALGNFTVHADNATAITGIQATGIVGSFGEEVDEIFALTGVQATCSVGTLSVVLALSFSGVTATGQVGSTTAQISSSPSGLSATSSLGSVLKTFTVSLPVQLAVTAVGTIVSQDKVVVSVPTSTTALGSFALTTKSNLTDITATTNLGTLAKTISVALGGISASTTMGTLDTFTTSGGLIDLHGLAAVTTLGTLVPSIRLALTGQSVTASLAALIPKVSITLPTFVAHSTLSSVSIVEKIALASIACSTVLGSERLTTKNSLFGLVTNSHIGALAVTSRLALPSLASHASAASLVASALTQLPGLSATTSHAEIAATMAKTFAGLVGHALLGSVATTQNEALTGMAATATSETFVPEIDITSSLVAHTHLGTFKVVNVPLPSVTVHTFLGDLGLPDDIVMPSLVAHTHLGTLLGFVEFDNLQLIDVRLTVSRLTDMALFSGGLINATLVDSPLSKIGLSEGEIRDATLRIGSLAA